MSPDHSLLYVADSESSSIRVVSLPVGSVKAVVGGAIDPLVCAVGVSVVGGMCSGCVCGGWYVQWVCLWWVVCAVGVSVVGGMCSGCVCGGWYVQWVCLWWVVCAVGVSVVGGMCSGGVVCAVGVSVGVWWY